MLTNEQNILLCDPMPRCENPGAGTREDKCPHAGKEKGRPDRTGRTKGMGLQDLAVNTAIFSLIRGEKHRTQRSLQLPAILNAQPIAPETHVHKCDSGRRIAKMELHCQKKIKKLLTKQDICTKMYKIKGGSLIVYAQHPYKLRRLSVHSQQPHAR